MNYDPFKEHRPLTTGDLDDIAEFVKGKNKSSSSSSSPRKRSSSPSRSKSSGKGNK